VPLPDRSDGSTKMRTDSLPIVTERLLLRELAMDDFDSIYRLCQQSKTGDWFPRWDMDEIRARKFLEWQIVRYKTWDIVNDTVSLAIVRKDADDLIGHCGVGRHEVLAETEIFVGIEKEHRGRGYATESATALTGWAFATFGIPFLCPTIPVENLPSQRVFERCGYTFIMTRTIDYPGDLALFRYYRMRSPVQGPPG
jgi:ribosomal-protein-alanine N-acetyltransferase